MTSFIASTRSRYEVPADMLEDAVRVMQEHDDMPNDIRHDAETDATYIVYPEYGNVFGGYVRSDWGEAVDDFLRRFCVPGSYATFRDDDDFMGYHLFVRKEFGVESCYEEHLNPWDEICDQLDHEPTAPVFVAWFDGRFKTFTTYEDAFKFCKMAHDVKKGCFEEGGVEWTHDDARYFYVEKVQRLVTFDAA